MPGLISAGIFSFTLSWNEFIYALAFIQSSEKKTVPVAILTELVSGDVYQWGALMAGSAARIAAGCDLLLVLRRLLRVVALAAPSRSEPAIRPSHAESVDARSPARIRNAAMPAR